MLGWCVALLWLFRELLITEQLPFLLLLYRQLTRKPQLFEPKMVEENTFSRQFSTLAAIKNNRGSFFENAGEKIPHLPSPTAHYLSGKDPGNRVVKAPYVVLVCSQGIGSNIVLSLNASQVLMCKQITWDLVRLRF